MSYFRNALDPERRAKVVRIALDVLQRRASEFDSIAVRGMSGATMGAILAYALDKPLVIVRKDEDQNHDGGHVTTHTYGRATVGRFLVVDDFISSGATVRAIVGGITQLQADAKPVGLYLYQQQREYRTQTEHANLPIWSVRAPEDLRW